MKEVLSQSEIDALLNALDSGEINAVDISKDPTTTDIKKYDFRRPNKFTKDQLRTLQMIHENFARMLSNFLSGYLRTTVSINIVSVDQLTYEDFLVSIPGTTLMTIFEMQPLTGSAVLECNHNFTFPIIDLLFGGSGKKMGKVRELTDIELGVLRKLNQRILENMAYAWGDVFKFTPKIESLETNPQFNQIISPNETVAIITFSSDIGENQGILNICLPFITLEGVISKLSAHFWFASHESGGPDKTQDKIKKRLSQVSLTLAAVCGETELTVRDFLQLSEGDVITLDKNIQDDMDLLVEGYPKYKIQPGVVGEKFAVQVTEKLQEET
ncbi:MAG: flagellar motor switch protein FliM [Clostridiales bacterium]|jgi:flagellar motor switch protein FliM|nr:flagellar motor switch protein FliM [Clostridiales bacterium]